METKFKLNEIEYTIKEVEDLYINCNIYANYEEQHQLIRVDKNLKQDVKTNSILHEIVHLILGQQQQNELFRDEVFVQNLTNDLIQVFNNYFLAEKDCEINKLIENLNIHYQDLINVIISLEKDLEDDYLEILNVHKEQMERNFHKYLEK